MLETRKATNKKAGVIFRSDPQRKKTMTTAPQRSTMMKGALANWRAKREVEERVNLIYNLVKLAEKKRQEDLNRVLAVCQKAKAVVHFQT